MKHWTIRWRIVASFAVILALMIVMATVAYVLLKRIDASEIAATTAEIGATSREIAARSKQLVGMMHEVATVAEQSAFLAAQGQGVLTHMEETMGRVIEAAGQISAKRFALQRP
jgi:methyl-accepting chemotaxis protein WspA